jgi:hypothetical protein
MGIKDVRPYSGNDVLQDKNKFIVLYLYVDVK